MNKHLLSTSAIALGVAMAAPASAQQWDMDWGGFYVTSIGITDVDDNVNPATDFDGLEIFSNAEIIFRPSVTLDNGLTFGAEVQFEALNEGTGGVTRANGDDQIDESYISIYSDTLGRIDIGSENSAGYKMTVAAPQVGSLPINSASVSAFVPFTGSGGFRQASISTFTEVAGNNDIERITYYTPSFNGLTVGVSYAPSNGLEATNFGPVDTDATGVLQDIFDIGIAYSQTFNGVDVNLSARWGTGDFDGSGVLVPLGQSVDPTTWAIGGQVGVNGFTFGVGYAENDQDLAGGFGDQEGLSIGAAYDLKGPWTVGLEGYFSETDAAPNDLEQNLVKLTGSRTLGAGVSWDVWYLYVDTENAANDSIEGNVIGTTVALSF